MTPIPALSDLVEDILLLNRQYRQYQRAHQRLDLQIKAIERAFASDQGRHEAQAARVAGDEELDLSACDAQCLNVELEDESDQKGVVTLNPPVALVPPKPRSLNISTLLALGAAKPLIEARAHLQVHRDAAGRELKKLAVQLPVWAWAQDVRGCGALTVALIVGEAGDLSRYDNPAKLWKRMGLAVMPDGRAQRRVRAVADAIKGRTKAMATAEAIAQGYSPHRRSLMHVVGENLVKLNDGYLRAMYDERKAYEQTREPEMSKLHAHRRAMRYIEKRLLRDLWTAWRRTTIHCQTPEATLSSVAEKVPA